MLDCVVPPGISSEALPEPMARVAKLALKGLPPESVQQLQVVALSLSLLPSIPPVCHFSALKFLHSIRGALPQRVTDSPRNRCQEIKFSMVEGLVMDVQKRLQEVLDVRGLVVKGRLDFFFIVRD